MKDSKMLREMGAHFGVKNFMEMRFVKPKKVLVQLEKDDEVYENVESILITEFPSLVSIDINYISEKGNECSVSSSLSYFKGITVLD